MALTAPADQFPHRLSCSEDGLYIKDIAFDPELEYAKVITEARRHAEMMRNNDELRHGRDRPALDCDCIPAQFEARELERSLEGLKERKTWKRALYFWRRSKSRTMKISSSSACSTPPSKSKVSEPLNHFSLIGRSRNAYSGPIYTDHEQIIPRSASLRWSKPNSLIAQEKGQPQVPYVALNHRRQSRFFSPRPPAYFAS